MNTLEKLRVLGNGTKWDVCTPAQTKRKVEGADRVGAPYAAGVCRSFTPDGKCVSLLKVLQTNSCVHDCKYCVHNTGCKLKQKAFFEPKELAELFMQMYLRNYVEGLFLSSGVIKDAGFANENMARTVEILRNQYHFQGYVHLKIMPGSSREDIRYMAGYADRVSLNTESPTKSAFSELCSTKDYIIDVRRRLRWINELKRKHEVSSGATTQFVVGAAGETDLDYLNAMETMYEKYGLKKAYFSAFDPVKGTQLEQGKSIPLRRENFLYRVDWLLRFYHYSFDEARSLLQDDGNLSLGVDPKVQYAQNHPELFPLEVNGARFEELLRVPGIGLTGAQRISDIAQERKFRGVEELKQAGLVSRKALPYLTVNGGRQLSLGAFG